MKKLFFGGVHPNDKKALSLGTTELALLSPKTVTIPLKQHIGVPCLPLVKVGDTVLRGQKIGDGEGLSVPVHASVSGKVIAIEAHSHPGGEKQAAIVIENDFQNQNAVFTPLKKEEHPDPDTVLHAIREAGIVGMGGAAFPGNVKALSALGKIDTLIANASECEPYITADDMQMRTNPQEVLEGMMIMAKLLSPERLVLAIENNKPEAIAKMTEYRERFPSVEIVILPTRYPQGAEKQLVQAVTARQVPPGGLPAHVGCAVFNVSTYRAIYQAVAMGMPLIERIVTVSGEGVNRPQNLIVPIGTSFEDVITAAGGLNEQADRVIHGGPMMGVAQEDLSAPVVKATNSVLCLTANKNGSAVGTVCIRCGKCVEACPMHLQPIYIRRSVLSGQTKELVRLHVSDCMECGCCSYICPGKLPLVDFCRDGKKLVKEAN